RPPEALVARSPEPTDRVFARGRERRLKDLFTSARWSREAQARALVVERDGEIVWVPGLLRGEATVSSGGLELRAVRLLAERLPTPR
ncbi:MAG: tRNA lysidine(34) synthetase TilS C-terminal domain-containing protein, partial [bacterium]